MEAAGGFLDQWLTTLFDRGEPEIAITTYFLLLARILPLIQQCPFLGAKILPNPVKMIFALCLSTIFLPKVLFQLSGPLQFGMPFLLLAGKEFVIGFIIGFFANIPFSIMQNIGFIIDHQRGAASLMINDPTIQNQASPMGTLFNYLLIIIFYISNGIFIFFDLVATSYDVIPPDVFLNSTLVIQEGKFAEILFDLLNQFMKVSIQLAAPSIIIILMTDFFLGIANRLAPQVQITFLGMGLKSTIPIAVLTAGWYLFCQALHDETITWFHQVETLIREIGKASA